MTSTSSISKYIVIDTETTGIKYSEDEILQLAIIDQDANVLFNKYFKPINHSRWDNAQKINGIKPSDVKFCKPIKSYEQEIRSILSKYDLLIGYNTRFDWNMLNANIDLSNITIRREDVMYMYKSYCKKRDSESLYKLTNCAEYFDFDWKTTGSHAHDALGDCYATRYCYEKLINLSNNKKINSKAHSKKSNSLKTEKNIKFDKKDLIIGLIVGILGTLLGFYLLSKEKYVFGLILSIIGISCLYYGYEMIKNKGQH